MTTAKEKTNILITGGTGYIGGSVLTRFLERSDFPSLNITALVRSHEKAEVLKKLGVNAVVGSHSDADFMEKLASTADIGITIADVDDLDAAKAFLRGLKKRHEVTGKVPILIHTSGTGIFADNAIGNYASDTIYDDLNSDQIDSIPPTQPHRPVDLEIINADKKGYIRSYIIAPSTIYGIPTGKLVDLGIQNKYSIPLPALIDASLARGQGGMVGEGKNLWPNVSNDDIADLFHTLYDSIIANPNTGHGRDGFYFGENGEYSFYDVAKATAEILVEIGKGKSPEPTSFTKEEIDKYFGGSLYLGSNARCRGNRSRSIGWKPKNTNADMFASIRPEVDAVVKGERKPVSSRRLESVSVQK